MALADLQRLLARLYTDTAFRDRFFAEPEATALEMGVSVEDATQAAQVSRSQVIAFANSLQSKRLNEVEKLLPLTRRALGRRFGSMFRSFADGYVPRGIKKHHNDALAYADYLIAQAGLTALPPWITEVARYERLLLESAALDFCVRLCRFRVAILDLVRGLALTEPEPYPVFRTTFILCYRWTRNGPLHRIQACLPARRIVTNPKPESRAI